MNRYWIRSKRANRSW